MKNKKLILPIVLLSLFLFFISMSYMGSEGFDWFAGLISKEDKAVNSIAIRTWGLIIIGIGLSIAGTAMQGITRNSLASAYSFGTIASATLAILIVNYILELTFSSVVNYLFILFFTFCISAVILFITFSSIVDTRKAVVIGLTFSVFISSVNYILQNYFDIFATNGYIGILALASLTMTWSTFWLSMPGIIGGSLVLIFFGKQIGIYRADPEKAKTLSISPRRLKIIVSISVVFISTSVALLVGPLGFVGLVIPHMTKLFFRGSSVRTQMLINVPISMILMLIANILVRYFTQYGININIILTLMSAPIVIYYVMRGSGND